MMIFENWMRFMAENDNDQGHLLMKTKLAGIRRLVLNLWNCTTDNSIRCDARKHNWILSNNWLNQVEILLLIASRFVRSNKVYVENEMTA